MVSRHTITHEVQNDSLDIRPGERALDLDGPVFARRRGRLGVTPEHKELIITTTVAVVAAIAAMTRDKSAAE